VAPQILVELEYGCKFANKYFQQKLALRLGTLDCHFEQSLGWMGLELMLNCMGPVPASHDASWV
jgi:hypothetical protein